MFPDITSFITELERRKDLARIGEPVDPELEISAVIDRVSKSDGGGPALMFEKPTLMSLAQNGTKPQRITSKLRSPAFAS